MPKLKKYLVFNGVALVCTAAVFAVANLVSLRAAFLAEIAWVVVVLAVNFAMIAREPEDMLHTLRASDRDGRFSGQVASLSHSYQVVLSRESDFARLKKDDPLRRAYDLVITQVRSDLKSASQYMASYEAAHGAPSSYLTDLCANSASLAEKVSRLVEQAIKIESIKDDVDTSYVDDLLAGLERVVK